MIGEVGDAGYTSILLAEGEYTVEVKKITDEWIYSKTRYVFLAADSSVKLNFNLIATPTAIRKQRLAREEKARQEKKQDSLAKQYALDKKSGIITANKIGLLWKRCSEGQTWTGTTCSGEASKYSWQSAIKHAKTVEYAGYDDWRLPTIKELNTLVYCSNNYQIKYKKDGFNDTGGCSKGGDYKKPTINQRLFPNTPSNAFWSSSPNTYNSNIAWNVVGFDNGNDYYGYLASKFYVRLVRASE